MADFDQLVMGRRTIRRFKQEPISRDDLLAIVKAGSYAPSAGNGQPWQFIVVDDPETVRAVNAELGWLGGAPSTEQAPVAHVVALLANPKRRWAQYADGGAALTTMSLAAWARGIGSCWIGSFDHDKVRALLAVPEEWELLSVLALGRPDEEPLVKETRGAPSARRATNGVLTVTKRALETIVHLNQFGRPLAGSP